MTNNFEIKNISKKEYSNLDYPYYNLIINDKELIKLFKLLRNYKPLISFKIPDKKKRNLKKIKLNDKFNKPLIFIENYNNNNKLYNITNYYSELCRMKCIYNTKNYNSKISPLIYFNNNKELIWNKLSVQEQINLHNIREYIWLNHKQCTNFNTTIVISLLKLFKPKIFLDPSAGWGDRLIGALAYGKCDYIGVDPSNCMHNIYKKIIKELSNDKKVLSTKKQKNNSIKIKNKSIKINKDINTYKVYKNGFENIELPKKYINGIDFIFTSPPFFDLEIYEKLSDTQSIEKFNTLDKWINGFLYPMIDKCEKYLSIDGHLALYISDYTGHNYVNEMKRYIKEYKTNLISIGSIYWITIDNNNNKYYKPREIFIWKKIIIE